MVVTMGETIAWARLMRVGLGRMGLSPDTFWGLTPAEFLVMAGIEGGTAGALTRAGLAALEARFPDRAGEDKGDG